MSGKLISEISAATGLPVRNVERLIDRAPFTYKIYKIKKRSGGDRTIAQPARETKLIQRWLNETIFEKFPIHECATAYKRGSSIKLNAEAHQSSRYLLKLDFTSFFPSIKYDDIFTFLKSKLSHLYTDDDIKSIALVSSFNDIDLGLGLSVGAPTSPKIANAIMFEFDSKISEWCKENETNYTRYADDLAFSTNVPNISSSVEAFVSETVSQLQYPTLSFNKEKTTHLSKKSRRRITGLILTNEGSVSLGRARKREISALIHKFSKSELDDNKINYLQGLLGFARDVEPLFVLSMDRKYGNSLLNDLFRYRTRSRGVITPLTVEQLEQLLGIKINKKQ